MTFLLTIAAIIFTLFAAYHVVTPFLASKRDQLRFEVLDEGLRRVEELASRRALLLQELRDITLDRQTGKIAEDDYQDLKRRYERQAVKVMRELDELHGGRDRETAIDEELERRLARFAKERGEPEPTPAERDVAEVDQDFVECVECGKRLEPEARFCSRCGTSLIEDEDTDDNSDDVEPAPASIESRALSNSGSEVAT